MTLSKAREAVPRHTRLPIGLHVEIRGDGAPVFGQIQGYDNDNYVIRIGGTDSTRSVAAASVLLHPSYERINSALKDAEILTQILARRLPVGLHVEVNDGVAPYYGQITGYFECQYRVRVGGTAQTNDVPPESVSAHPMFRAIKLEQQRKLFEHLPRLPKTGALGSEERLTRALSEELEMLIRNDQIKLPPEHDKPPQVTRDPSLLGVGLFKICPHTETLSFWTRLNNPDVFNGAMVDNYQDEEFNVKVQGSAKALCLSLLERSKVLEYLNQLRSDLSNYNVIAHLHYYRNREVPDPGFHKDTRGQTLFFMLQYLNEKPIFGPEWVEDAGMDKLQEPNYVWVTSGGKQYLKNSAENVFWQPDGKGGWKAADLQSWEIATDLHRISPVEGDGVWPKAIRDALNFEKKKQNDPKIHVARIDPFGAVLVVDDLVHHRSPNQKSRDDWDNYRGSTRSQAITVQAFDAHHVNSLHGVDLTRDKRARSMSDAREKWKQWQRWRQAQQEQEAAEKAIVDEGLVQAIKQENLDERWANTFDRGQRRKFFRLWVTISPKPVRKPDDKVWY